jgi:heme exporter protein CcmD
MAREAEGGRTLVTEWWQFNGYGFYIWGSYLVTVAVVAVESVLLAARRRNAEKRLEEIEDMR